MQCYVEQYIYWNGRHFNESEKYMKENQRNTVQKNQNIFGKKMFFIQCVQSSLSQNGGADLRSPFGGKFLKALKSLVPSPQLFPEIFGFAQRSFWWAAGSKQPSPPLRPVVTDLLNGNQLLHQYLS